MTALLAEAEDKKCALPSHVGKELVILPVVAVAHVDLSRQAHVAQGPALTAFAPLHFGILGLAFHQIEAHMQPHPVGIPVAPDPVFRPRHPGQRAPQAAILGDELEFGQRGVGRGVRGSAPGQILEHLVQQRRIHHMLHLREIGPGDPGARNLLLHPRQGGDGAQSAHGFNHRIEQSKQEQSQVAALAELPLPVGVRQVDLQLGCGALDRLFKLLEHAPVVKIGFGDLRLRGLLAHDWHAAIRAEWLKNVQVTIVLQSHHN